jgi:hypothetical protein
MNIYWVWQIAMGYHQARMIASGWDYGIWHNLATAHPPIK